MLAVVTIKFNLLAFAKANTVIHLSRRVWWPPALFEMVFSTWGI